MKRLSLILIVLIAIAFILSLLAGRVWLAQDKLEDALKEFVTTAKEL